MAARKTSTTTKAATAVVEAPAPRRRTRKAADPVVEILEVHLSPEESEARLREEIAIQAYLLWESGAAGSESDHWLAAEQAVRSA